MPTEPTDDELVARVRAGDTSMFEILMRRYNQRLYRTARAILQNDADAEDAVQQTYLNAYRHLAQFEGRAQFSTWLTRIALHEALGRKRHRRHHLGELGSQETVDGLASTRPDPERLAHAAQVSTLVDAAVAALPYAYRSVFILREVEGLDTAQTARQLSLTEPTVKTRLHRAKALLRKGLHRVRSTPAADNSRGLADILHS